MIRTVIIDDEQGARNVIRELIQRLCPNVEIVGEGNNVDSGYKVIKDKQPDLVLLDVEMPGGSGFNILERLENVNFKIIFITAFDQYALKAIKASAVDYILKPVNSKELTEAIKKVENSEFQKGRIASLLSNVKSKNGINKLAIYNTGKIFFLEIKDIIRCEAEGSYTFIYMLDGKKYLSSKALKEYDDLLNDRHFFRIHRSHLINLQMVESFEKGDRDVVNLKDKSNVEVSRKKRTEFVEAMEKVYL